MGSKTRRVRCRAQVGAGKKDHKFTPFGRPGSYVSRCGIFAHESVLRTPTGRRCAKCEWLGCEIVGVEIPDWTPPAEESP